MFDYKCGKKIKKHINFKQCGVTEFAILENEKCYLKRKMFDNAELGI